MIVVEPTVLPEVKVIKPKVSAIHGASFLRCTISKRSQKPESSICSRKTTTRVRRARARCAGCTFRPTLSRKQS